MRMFVPSTLQKQCVTKNKSKINQVVMKGDSSYQNQIVPMNNSNRSPVETCYGILKHCFPSTKYHLPPMFSIHNDVRNPISGYAFPTGH